MFNLIKSSFHYIVLLIFIVTINTIISTFLPKFIQILIDNDFKLSGVITLFLLGISVPLITALLGFIGMRFRNALTVRLHTELLYKVMRTKFEIFESKNIGEIFSRSTNDISTIINFFSTVFISIYSNMLALFIIVPIMLSMSLKLGLIIIFSTLVMVFINLKQTNRIKSLSEEIKCKQDQTISEKFQYFTNIEMIKSENIEVEVREKHKKSMLDMLVTANRLELLNNVLSTSSNFISTIMMCAVIGYGLILRQNGEMSYGQITAFLIYYNQVFQPAVNIINVKNMWSSVMPSITRLEEYIAFPEDNYNGIILKEVKNISLNNVGVLRKEKELLYNYHFVTGQSYAITGENGSGKSTLLKLILGMYTPSCGDLLLNSVRINQLDVIYRGKIDYMSQSTQLPYGKISETLKINQKNIKLFKKLMGVFMLENALPLAEETIILEKNNLSGGEIQSLKIIKVILSDKEVLLLDEPTNNLDYFRREVFYDLFKTIKKLVIVVTHDLKLQQLCTYNYRLGE